MATQRIHIAGFPVRVGGKGRQLCAWCGERLVDIDYERTMVAPNADGTPGEGPRFFEINELVAVEGTNPRAMYVVQLDDGDNELPVLSCAFELKLRVVE